MFAANRIQLPIAKIGMATDPAAERQFAKGKYYVEIVASTPIQRRSHCGVEALSRDAQRLEGRDTPGGVGLVPKTILPLPVCPESVLGKAAQTGYVQLQAGQAFIAVSLPESASEC